ncbi:Alpha/Beta hydrolase protein [Rhexocercosporidium sp. MPI-PUGE-AT-0058]|nr:Alpha/Beta hydrolase protein [Rhexocercosporidium sp. MPI-PUGE-AT-0058]
MVLHLLSTVFTITLLASQALALPSLSPIRSPHVIWGKCGGMDPPNLQCGKVQVPVDYDNPHGAQLNVTFARLKAPNATDHLGSLIFNPGGPGGVASDMVYTQVFWNISVWSPKLVAQYDIIGLDPRGTGLSNPMLCDPKIWNQRINDRPKNQEEFDKLVAYNKAFSESCKTATGPVFDFLGTGSAARDMDMVRRALGEDKLNFLGLSYGSDLGSTYAGLYPEHVGRMVLDGILDTSSLDTYFLATAATTYEATLNKFFDWCNTNSDCALHGQDPAGVFDSLIARASETPIPAPGCTVGNVSVCFSDVTDQEILGGVQGGLKNVVPLHGYGGWASLSVAIAEAAQGNATRLSVSMKTSAQDPAYSFLGVICKDWPPSSKNHFDLALKREFITALSPHTKGGVGAYSTQAACIGWASPPTPLQVLTPKQVAKLPKILLVNSFWDPSTSVTWANALKVQIPSSVLILRNGSGHVSYFNDGKTSAAMETFFLTGETPAQGAIFDS